MADATETHEWAITFGQVYRREPHPTLGFRPELPDGWATVTAETEIEARRQVAELIGTGWAFIYGPGELPAGYFPAGNLGALADLAVKPAVDDWTIERLDALPEGTVIAWEECGFIQAATKDDGSWDLIGGGWIRDRQNILIWADPGSIRVVSVPINALCSDETICIAAGGHVEPMGHALDPAKRLARSVIRAAIAHVTGGAS